jgi:predicted component of type VI protein secretion system
MAAKVTLTILGGALDGTEYAFDKPAKCVIIGRGENCSVRLPNRGWEFQMVSRHHCKLDIDPPHVGVRDLGSRNGTYINGRLIGLRDSEESPESAAGITFAGFHLHDTDILAVGPVHFRVNVQRALKAPAKIVESAVESGPPEAEKSVEHDAAKAMVFAT